jgi:hypothetical protein
MTFKKTGMGEVIQTEPQDSHLDKVAKEQGWSESDEKDLQEESEK